MCLLIPTTEVRHPRKVEFLLFLYFYKRTNVDFKRSTQYFLTILYIILKARRPYLLYARNENHVPTTSGNKTGSKFYTFIRKKIQVSFSVAVTNFDFTKSANKRRGNFFQIFIGEHFVCTQRGGSVLVSTPAWGQSERGSIPPQAGHNCWLVMKMSLSWSTVV